MTKMTTKTNRNEAVVPVCLVPTESTVISPLLMVVLVEDRCPVQKRPWDNPTDNNDPSIEFAREVEIEGAIFPENEEEQEQEQEEQDDEIDPCRSPKEEINPTNEPPNEDDNDVLLWKPR